MSLLKTNAVQLGQSLTANNNFVWYQPEVPDGTIRLAVGNSGSNADILTVNSSGFLNVTGSFKVNGADIAASITDDTTTNTSHYPILETATSGLSTAVRVSSTKLYFNPSTGTLNATIFNSLSDANQKVNISTITNATETLSKVEGVEFDWVDNGEHSAGVIAQKLEEILPFLVHTNEGGIKSVNYSGLIAYLIEAIKELKLEVENLKNHK
jgi:hypothetical protein